MGSIGPELGCVYLKERSKLFLAIDEMNGHDLFASDI
jgi:hypothetical protein